LKLTILGGEPTLYDVFHGNKDLLEVIRMAKNVGYDYVRISTNGTFEEELLERRDFKRLDEIAFSLDGFSSRINDPIRGSGTFNKITSNIKHAVKLGYTTSITCCLHKRLLEEGNDGNPLLDRMIKFAETLNVDCVNFHDLFEIGVPMDTWTGNLNPSVEEWPSIYRKIRRHIDARRYRIHVRLPTCFITKEEFGRNQEYYGYCPAKLGERVMVHPNGIIRICSNLICTSHGVAKFHDNKIVWDISNSNELLDHKLGIFTACTNRGKKNFGNFVPLCFSFKPKQEEVVWKELKWDTRDKAPDREEGNICEVA